MTRHSEASLQARLAGLPPLPTGAELILRPNDAGAVATIRSDGQAPQVFALDADGVHELHAEQDRDLPGAALLADPARLEALLEPRIGRIASSRLVAWRPARRAVLCVQTVAGPRVWLKLLDRKTHRRAKAAFAALPATLEPLVLQRPTFVLDDVCGLLAEDAAGVSLRTLLARGDELPWALLARAVLALSYTATHGELPHHDAARARDAALVALRQGTQLVPELEALLGPLGDAALPPTPSRLAFVHGDLHDKQLFLAEGRVSLIDLEGMALGDPRFDVANLAEHLRLRELQQHGDDRGLAERLLARCGHAADEPALTRFRALVRARLCGVYALRPRWRALVDRLALETRTLLQETP